MSRILYVTTISNTINAFLVPHIEMLIEQGHKVDIATNISEEIEHRLIELGCTIFNIEFNRSPINKSNILAYKKMKQLIIDGDYDVVHVHTPVASFITRLVCKHLKDIKVIYTAHGFHFYKGAPLKNWILYYPLEWYASKFTDVIITINKEDFIRAKKLKAKEVEYVPGVGLDIDKFNNIDVDKEKKRKELGIPSDNILLLSVGELNKNKNHKVIIKALSEIENKNVHYVIAGRGRLKGDLIKLSVKLNISDRVHLLGYRKDIGELYKVSDIFCFPSKREGLPVSVMEAMVCGLPVICSNIRGSNDLLDEGKGGFLFDLKKDVPKILNIYLRQLINDDKLRESMSNYNANKVNEFDIESVKKCIHNILSNLEYN